MTKPILGYWDIRGIAEPIRYVYHYLDIEFEDKRYPFGPPPNYDEQFWWQEKTSLGLDFPNLPYLIDGCVKLSQSNVILRYLARKYNLDGQTEEEQLRVDLSEQQIYDLRLQMFMLLYRAPNYEAARATYLENLPKYLEQVSRFLAERNFLAGTKLTYVDFMLYDYLDIQRLYAEAIFDEFDNLKLFLKRIEALPTIEKYMKSDQFPGKRLWWPKSKWPGPN